LQRSKTCTDIILFLRVTNPDKPMKIAMILDSEFPPDPRVENEANSLMGAGHSVILFCIDYRNRLEKEMHNGIQVYRIKAPKIIYSLSALAYSFPFYRWFLQKKLKNFFSDVKPDAVHVHDMQVAKTVLRALGKNQIPKILDLHENRPVIMQFYEHVRKFPGNILIRPNTWKQWEKKLVKNYDKVVVVTHEAQQYLIDNYQVKEDKIVVFPNTVHPSFYNDLKPHETILKRFENKYMIFYLGDTGKRRGLETAINAIEILRKTIPDVVLVIAGKSKYDVELKRLVRDKKLSEYVSFEGYQDMKRVPSYILASKVCISPLHRNIHHDTTYANKIFQYMSLGIPVLVSNCTAQKNVVENANAGLVHQAENAKDFADKILEFYKLPELAIAMGESGKKFVRTSFNQVITSNELVRLYNNFKEK
jgi:glycosyltransferase involved in cell wall biosynthesis